MAPTISLFGISMQTYPLAIVVSVWVGLWVSERTARRAGMEQERIYNLGFYSLLATVIGARLSYAVDHWQAYQGAWLSILSLTPTGFAWPGGVAVGFLVATIYGWRKHLPAGLTLDALAPGLALALAIERLGAFLAGSGLGLPTRVPWGVTVWDVARHPIQLYEMAALLAVWGVLWRLRDQRRFDGEHFALFVVLYAGLRLFLEAFRAETLVLTNGLRIIQIVAFAVMMGTVWILYRRRFQRVVNALDDGQLDT